MKVTSILIAGILVCIWADPLWAEAPELEKGVHVKNGGKYLEVEINSVPTAVDWNNDGAKDLVIGQLIEGYIWLFLNKGTDLNPVYNGGDYVYSGGQPISVSCC